MNWRNFDDVKLEWSSDDDDADDCDCDDLSPCDAADDVKSNE